MVLGEMFERFATASAISVMTRGAMQHALSASALDAMFEQTAAYQYTRELLFSTVVDLASVVVCAAHQSMHAAYQAARDRIPVSLTAVYDKLNRIEPKVSAELVRHTAMRLAPVIEAMGGALPELLPGYRVKIIDGNHLASTERRVKAVRGSKAGPRPGFGVVILDPRLMLAIDVAPCEDAHAQERSLTDALLEKAAPNDLILADRNFCTSRMIAGLVARGASFVIREHGANLAWEPDGARHRRGRREGATIYEQAIETRGADGNVIRLRRITLELDAPIRKGETELHLVTDLPVAAADAMGVAALYRHRWTIETMFQDLQRTLHGEIKALGQPPAALFCFCVALAAYNVLSTVKAALRGEHGHAKIEDEVSEYYIADEIRGTYRGMMIAIPPPEWTGFDSMASTPLARLLRAWAGKVKLSRFRRHARGPKKPVPPRTRYTTQTHISTARILAEYRNRKSP
jgi:hypothetical protein